jgi:hypothetical protein
MSSKKKPKEKPHYINNADFSDACVAYVKDVAKAKANGTELPRIPEYLGECFLKLCQGLASKPNFSQYTYKEEMIMDAVENCLSVVTNYKVDTETRSGRPNAFGYFTMISWRAFLRRIQKEKRQQDIKERLMDLSSFDTFAEGDCFSGGESMLQKIRGRNDILRKRHENQTEPEFKVVKRARSKNKTTSSLNDFIDGSVHSRLVNHLES